MTPEQYERRRMYSRKYYASLTPEEKKAHIAKQAEYNRIRRAKRTPEEIERERRYNTKYMRQYRAKMTPEQKEKRRMRDRERYAKKKLEQRGKEASPP